MEDRCICCGEIIPEGQQICPICQEGTQMNKEGYKDPTAEIAVHRASRMPRYIWNIFKELNLAAGKSGTRRRGRNTGGDSGGGNKGYPNPILRTPGGNQRFKRKDRQR